MDRNCGHCRWWIPDPETKDPNADNPDKPTCGECALISRLSEKANARIVWRPPFNAPWIEHQSYLFTDERFSCSDFDAKKPTNERREMEDITGITDITDFRERMKLARRMGQLIASNPDIRQFADEAIEAMDIKSEFPFAYRAFRQGEIDVDVPEPVPTKSKEAE